MIGRWLWRLLLVGAAALLALQVWYFGQVLWWSRFDPSTTAFMSAELDRLRGEDSKAQLRHQWVPYTRISSHLKRAVIASEDAHFTEHDGVDWDALELAWQANAKRGRVVRGGSTITMQLAKNLFLSGERSYWRKAQELVISYMIELVMDKRRILELYLNVAEWGVGVFGAEAGARHHFGHGADRLEPAEAARMAAMLPNPRWFDSHRGAPKLLRKAVVIERRMAVAPIP
jgi:monofunctional biosynthetic peptidoglycan transglycosylase